MQIVEKGLLQGDGFALRERPRPQIKTGLRRRGLIDEVGATRRPVCWNRADLLQLALLRIAQHKLGTSNARCAHAVELVASAAAIGSIDELRRPRATTAPTLQRANQT